jgi:hypothetical protein
MQGLTTAEITTAITTALAALFDVDTATPFIGEISMLDYDEEKFYYGNVRVSGKKANLTSKARFYAGEATEANMNLNVAHKPGEGGNYNNVVFNRIQAENANIMFEGYVLAGSFVGGIDDGDGGQLDI